MITFRKKPSKEGKPYEILPLIKYKKSRNELKKSFKNSWTNTYGNFISKEGNYSKKKRNVLDHYLHIKQA